VKLLARVAQALPVLAALSAAAPVFRPELEVRALAQTLAAALDAQDDSSPPRSGGARCLRRGALFSRMQLLVVSANTRLPQLLVTGSRNKETAMSTSI